jgi:hypothetical protein
MRLLLLVALAMTFAGCIGASEPATTTTTYRWSPYKSYVTTTTTTTTMPNMELPIYYYSDHSTTTLRTTSTSLPTTTTLRPTTTTLSGFGRLFQKVSRENPKETTTTSTLRIITTSTSTTIEGITPAYKNKYGGKYGMGGKEYNFSANDVTCIESPRGGCL